MQSRRSLARRPNVEELEGRVVPSTLSTSTNWSGYAVATGTGAVTAVFGSWKVPALTGADGYAASWVGIDGWTSSTVEQLGTESDMSGGVATYYAWYEMYPADSVTITRLTIHPGDTINASVTYSKGAFTLSLTDASQGNASFSITRAGAGLQRSSAEWIMEAPSDNFGVLPLANFGTESFSSARATISGSTGPINSPSWASKVQQVNMTDDSGSAIDSTSGIANSGSPATSAFTVTFTGATTTTPTPPPPKGGGGGGGGGSGWGGWGWSWGWGWGGWGWFSVRQTEAAAAQLAELASSSTAENLRLTTAAVATSSAQTASPHLPSVVASAMASFNLAGGGGSTSAFGSVGQAGTSQDAPMPLVLPDGNMPTLPRDAVQPRSPAEVAPMPPADPGALPGLGVSRDQACDACFVDGHWAPRAAGDGAQTMIAPPSEAGSAVESVAGVLLALSLGGYWHLGRERAERQRRKYLR
jgi:hypothetical protein